MLKKNADNSYEIDLIALFKALWKRVWIIIVCAFIVGAAFFAYAKLRIVPRYSSSTMLYVNNGGTIDVKSYKISATDLSTAQSLVSTYIVILYSRSCLNQVISEAGLDYSYGQLGSMISASAVDETEIFQITVTSTNPDEAALIANTIAEVLPEKISDIVDGSSVRVVDYAVVSRGRISPNYSRYAILGAVIGAVVSAIIIIIFQLLDDIIHSDEYITETYPDIPLLATIPDLTRHNRSAYSYGNKNKIARGYEDAYRSAVADDKFSKNNGGAK